MTSDQVLPKLLEAFEQDHVMLGRGFNQLSCCLRAGDPAGACAAARQLCEEAGAHIGFEEEDFYPALVPLLGEETVRRMRQEHCCGFDVICTLLGRGPDLPLHPDLGERLLAQSEVMEEHIAECGELFAAVRDIPPAKQQALYDRLIEWRRHPKLDLERRTVGCGALRLAQCHPAAMPTGAFERSSIPVSEGLAVRVGSDERRELARMAARLIAEDPALVTNDTLDPRTGSGIENGPALFYEDHSEIRFRSGACLDYRSRLLAGDGDIVMIGGQRRPDIRSLLPRSARHRRCRGGGAGRTSRSALGETLYPGFGTVGADLRRGTPRWSSGPRALSQFRERLDVGERHRDAVGRPSLGGGSGAASDPTGERQIVVQRTGHPGAGPARPAADPLHLRSRGARPSDRTTGARPRPRLYQDPGRYRRSGECHPGGEAGDGDSAPTATAIPVATPLRIGVA